MTTKTNLLMGAAALTLTAALATVNPALAQTSVTSYFNGGAAASAVFADNPNKVWGLDPSSGPTWELSARTLEDAFLYKTKVFYYPANNSGVINPCPISAPGGIGQIAGECDRLGAASPAKPLN